MNKVIKCAGCGQAYNLDLEKYGGKKVKCKKCQGPIAVPTAAEVAGEFEIVEEDSGSPRLPVPPIPEHVPTPIPTASQHGTVNVNIAVLQRSEVSREQIRQEFISLHRLQDPRSAPVESLRRQIAGSESAVAHSQEKLDWLKDVLARALASSRPEVLGVNLTKSHNPFIKNPLYKERDEEAYAYAIQIIGQPVAKEKKQGWAAFFEGSKGDRMAKIDTIKSAIEVGEATNRQLKESESVKREILRKQIEEFVRNHRVKLDQAKSQIASGNVGEATILLQEFLKTAPMEMLGQVLVALSQCSYLGGNPSQAGRYIQDAICFGGLAPASADRGYNELWEAATAVLPSAVAPQPPNSSRVVHPSQVASNTTTTEVVPIVPTELADSTQQPAEQQTGVDWKKVGIKSLKIGGMIALGTVAAAAELYKAGNPQTVCPHCGYPYSRIAMERNTTNYCRQCRMPLPNR